MSRKNSVEDKVLGAIVVVITSVCVAGIWIITSTIIAVVKKLLHQQIGNNTSSNIPPHNEGAQYTQQKPHKKTPSRDELQKLYRELVKKYHPDFAQSDTDKKFRTDLTAKINRAYTESDIDTLRMFQ